MERQPTVHEFKEDLALTGRADVHTEPVNNQERRPFPNPQITTQFTILSLPVDGTN